MSKIIDDPSVKFGSFIKVSRGTRPHRIVLREVGGVQPFVTHFENMKIVDDDTYGSDGFYWDHYFDTYEQALADFNERVKNF